MKFVKTQQVFAHFTSTALLSRPLSLGLFFVERAQDSASFSNQLLPIPQNCGTLLTRVYRIGCGQAAVGCSKRSGAAMGPQAEGLRGRQRRFFRSRTQNSDPEASHRPARRHSAKTRHLTRHLTLHGTLHRHRQHHRHRQPTFPKWPLWAPGSILAFQKIPK